MAGMKRFLVLAAAFALSATAAAAQVPTRPNLPFILTWTPAQQRAWYPAMETVYKVRTIKRGDHVRPLPKAARPIAPTWTYAGKPWTVARYMAAYRVSGLLVLKDGKIVLERYGLGRKPTDRWTSFSVAKSVTSTLVGAALKDGKIRSLEDPVTAYMPELKGSAYEGVTVRQLLMMSSGVKWNEDYTDPKSDVAKAGFEPSAKGVNPMVAYMARLPRDKPPGSTFHYDTGETDMVGILVSHAVGEPLSQYASEKLWKPIGMEQDGIWAVDYGGAERGGCCMSMTLRDYGRIGQFILEGGVAGGKPVVSAEYLRAATSPEIHEGAPTEGYGYFWWMRKDGFQAVGIYGQSITVLPKDHLVIVQNAAWPTATGKELSAARDAFIEAAKKAAGGR
jgi:CubicO group peptidase (beta-lactamase class C family)